MSQSKAARPSGQIHGVLLVDKPTGMTSFDVVAQARRAFGTRKVGHAGTLDPMATGVLVILLGEATKLSNVLTTDKKSYRTVVSLGTSTDSLDADGAIVRRAPLPSSLTRQQIEDALEAERQRQAQIPPQVSAIKVDGKRSYDQARKGVTVDLAPRVVSVHQLQLLSFDQHQIELEMSVSKGYYVRSLGRDLAESLGTVGHLSSLRRTKSGPFSIDETHPLPLSSSMPLLSLDEAARRCLVAVEVDAEGALHISQGKRLESSRIVSISEPQTRSAAGAEICAAFHAGRLIALIDQMSPTEYKVRRGMSYGPPSAPEASE